MFKLKNTRPAGVSASAAREKAERLAMRIPAIDHAVGAALESRGHIDNGDSVTIEGVAIRYWVYQPDRRTRVPLKRGDFGYRADEVVTKQVLVPSGRLALVADFGPFSGGGRRWEDKPNRPLEECIPAIVAGMEAMARRRIEDRIDRERWAEEQKAAMRRAAARYRRDLDEAERPARLQALADDWHRAQRLRAFLDALTVRLGSNPPAALAPWLSWARAHVASIDPLSGEGIADLASYAGLFAAPKDSRLITEEERYWRDEGWLDEYLDELEAADGKA